VGVPTGTAGEQAGGHERGIDRAGADGDRDAYEQLARGAARRLFLMASRILRDTDAAEDAVQQTLVAIWQDSPRKFPPVDGVAFRPGADGGRPSWT
jgi:DNA-directed RNA polymerase specialized sigma24 family protein